MGFAVRRSCWPIKRVYLSVLNVTAQYRSFLDARGRCCPVECNSETECRCYLVVSRLLSDEEVEHLGMALPLLSRGLVIDNGAKTPTRVCPLRNSQKATATTTTTPNPYLSRGPAGRYRK